MVDTFPSFIDDLAIEPASVTTCPPSTICNAPLGQQVAGNRSERYQLRPSGVSFQSEAFRLRTQAKVLELVRTAGTSPDVFSTNALLARRALKYRRVLERQSVYSATAMSC
uniref:Uncharacterized protein n=1 Tax=Hyaloperonospora arabidopsidis (strain Emoy2) TaxID=559515 RepID=M4BYK3_HYAAE